MSWSLIEMRTTLSFRNVSFGCPNLPVWERIAPTILMHKVLDLCIISSSPDVMNCLFLLLKVSRDSRGRWRRIFYNFYLSKNLVCGSSIYLKLTTDCVLVIMMTFTFMVTASWLLAPLCGRMPGNSRDYRIRLGGFKLLTVCNAVFCGKSYKRL